MAFGALIVGDEILVGKRQDKHLGFIAGALARRGLALAWAEYHGDDPERLTAALRRSFASGDVVFSFGGIGATPDDHTRQCAAAALGVVVALHPDGERELRARFGVELTPQRLRMVEFPAGASIIPNPLNRVPGFSIREHHFLPGFPQMAWPMAEQLLDTRYAHLAKPDRWGEASILVFEAGESQLIEIMETIGARYEGIKVFSLPSMGADGSRRHVELGVRGAPGQVARAIAQMRDEVARAGFPISEP